MRYPARSSARTIRLYPWVQFTQNLMFWQAVWFLFFQQSLSASGAILLYVSYELAVTLLEVPSGYMSDRLGRRMTLICSALASFAGLVLLALGSGFALFAVAQALIGAGRAFASGTDSALLFESLAAEGRSDEIETHELRAWRAGFAALALSALAGGVMAGWQMSLPFWASALSMVVSGALILGCAEPPRHLHPADETQIRLSALKAALLHPTLIWLFAISVLMYVYSHIPFIFGQPFVLSALAGIGLAAQAPVISGAVSAVMMGLSLTASAFAPGIRRRIGLRPTILLGFAMQIALAGMLALTNSVLAIAFLFLRMVPDALSRPFIMAQVQPLLRNESRATYLSVKSLVARVAFSASLWLAAGSANDAGRMAYAEMRVALGWYVLAGLLAMVLLIVTAQKGAQRARDLP